MQRAHAFDRLIKIRAVNLEPDKIFLQFQRGEGGLPDAEKWVENKLRAWDAVQFDAHFGELHRERRGMGTVSIAALDSFVRNEPDVAATV